ncbi:hypothetical protein BS50DRAFT_593134 [Corynespora cassiicola Philippines]|uniref:Uncharacterized protein n=1 Tax=Corynespora cassiicola Philippines TaxID=1448308 RepID=A0A2T2N6Y2_CORCC|nr:hypothetical protein BS50DRAFT_593134 [Corynespora cassiicola Philippines]
MPNSQRLLCLFGLECISNPGGPTGISICRECQVLHPRWQMQKAGGNPAAQHSVVFNWRLIKEQSLPRHLCITNDHEFFNIEWMEQIKPNGLRACRFVEQPYTLCEDCLSDIQSKPEILELFDTDGHLKFPCLRTMNTFKGEPGRALQLTLPDISQCIGLTREPNKLCEPCSGVATYNTSQIESATTNEQYEHNNAAASRLQQYTKWFDENGTLKEPERAYRASRQQTPDAPLYWYTSGL